jgi:hypothetical protein
MLEVKFIVLWFAGIGLVVVIGAFLRLIRLKKVSVNVEFHDENDSRKQRRK